MDWSTERIEQLRSLWRDGLSASQIAAVLGIEVGTVKVRVYRALRELGDRFFALRGERQPS